MTHAETKIFIKKIKFIYPRFMQDVEITTKEEFEEYINLWQELLSDLTLSTCAIALKRHVMLSKWAPTIADIRNQASKIINRDLNACESWEKCFKIALNFKHYEERNLNNFNLDDIEKRCLISIGIDEIKMSENIGVTRSNFIRIFNELNENKIIESKMPNRLKLENIKAIGQQQQNKLNAEIDNNISNSVESIKKIEQKQTKSDIENYYPNFYFSKCKNPIEKMAKALGIERKVGG